MEVRPSIYACYDHLSGIAGERLTRRLLALGWVTPEPEPGLTPQGWSALAALGIDLLPLTTSKRKPVAYCTERYGGQQYDHLGGHLGALLRNFFVRQQWLRSEDHVLTLTPDGDQMLQRLGVTLEDQP